MHYNNDEHTGGKRASQARSDLFMTCRSRIYLMTCPSFNELLRSSTLCQAEEHRPEEDGRRMDGILWMECRGQSIKFSEITEEAAERPVQKGKEKWRRRRPDSTDRAWSLS
jgi:hypothetical protein